MNRVLSVCLTGLLLAPASSAAGERSRLLVMPIFGLAPPELSLPASSRIAESLALELPDGVTVLAEEFTGRVVPEDIEGLVRARAAEQEAAAVVWGELRSPVDCRAPRLVRIRILDLKTGTILDRDLCPEGTTAQTLARAIAVSTTHALRSGLVEGLELIDPRVAARKDGIPEAPKKECPECPEPKPCPGCPPCDCTPPPPAPPERPRFFLAAGPLFTSHPRWEAYGLGFCAEVSWAPLGWLEVGVSAQATRGRGVGQEEVTALYTSWPVQVWGRLRFGSSVVEGTVDLGFGLAFTRLEALLERFDEVQSVDRLNPAALGRLGLRWWVHPSVGVHLLVGGTVYLRRQQYTYGVLGQVGGVLGMDPASMEGAILLVVPIR